MCLSNHLQGAPHPPISGPGAVGWRIQLYWGADQVWHEAEVLSFDEVGLWCISELPEASTFD